LGVGVETGVAVGFGVAVGTGVAVGEGVAVGFGVGVGVGEEITFRATACPLIEKELGAFGGVPLKVKPTVTLPPFAGMIEFQLAGVNV
jgi:hypothetical protein